LGDDPALRVEGASLALAAGDLDGAQRLLDGAGEGRAAAALRADLLEARGDHAGLDEALAKLARLLEGDGAERGRTLLRQGGARMRAGRAEEAYESYREATLLLAA